MFYINMSMSMPLCDKCTQPSVYGAIHLCQACFEIWSKTCDQCGAHTTVSTCSDCQRRCRSTFSTCWRCDKTDICEDCITTLRYDDDEELCTACYEAHNKNELERGRVFQEEFRKREANQRSQRFTPVDRPPIDAPDTRPT